MLFLCYKTENVRNTKYPMSTLQAKIKILYATYTYVYLFSKQNIY